MNEPRIERLDRFNGNQVELGVYEIRDNQKQDIGESTNDLGTTSQANPGNIV